MVPMTWPLQWTQQLDWLDMEDQGLEDQRPVVELMEVKVQSEDLKSKHADRRPAITDRDPKRINKSLKVTNEHRCTDLIDMP